MGNNGFTNRWLGKIMAKSLWIGSGGVQTPSVAGSSIVTQQDIAALGGAGLASTALSTAVNISNGGITTIPAATAAFSYPLADPFPGREKVLTTLGASSGARTVYGSSVVTFDGTNNKITFSASVLQSITLLGLSTARWAIKGTYPGGSTVGGSTVAQPALSTN